MSDKCKCKVYAESGDNPDENNLVECGEPVLIPGVCYDHCVLCKECREEPADPEVKVCPSCSTRKLLKTQLVVGAKIKLGEAYCQGRGCKTGDIITLVEGHFEYDNGLYTEDQTAPSVWNDQLREFDSIFHLFGNDLEDFEDCEVLTTDRF